MVKPSSKDTPEIYGYGQTLFFLPQSKFEVRTLHHFLPICDYRGCTVRNVHTYIHTYIRCPFGDCAIGIDED